jgi:hypothetical protein
MQHACTFAAYLKTNQIMKTKSLVLAALVAIGSLTAVAENDPRHTGLFIINGKSGVYKLIYEGEKPSVIDLTIYNSRGIVVYQETVRNIKGFMRPVNFRGMKADTYSIVVKSRDQRMETKIAYVPEISVNKVSSRKLNDRKYAILVSNTGEEAFEIMIYDSNKKLVEAYKESVTGSFGKIFNLSEVKSTSFTFEIYTSKGLIDTLKF